MFHRDLKTNVDDILIYILTMYKGRHEDVFSINQ